MPRRRLRVNQDNEEYAPRQKLQGQRPVDAFTPLIRHMHTRLYHRNNPFVFHSVEPHPYFAKDLLPVHCTPHSAATALCTQWVFSSANPDQRGGRLRVPLHTLTWSSNGRRLLSTTSKGEFLLFNGRSFGLEIKTVAHEDGHPCRGIAWGKHHGLVLSGDDTGTIKIWLSNFIYVGDFNSSHQAVREITWAPQERKFCTAGKDGSIKIWDTDTATSRTGSAAPMEEETKLEGHGGDVHTVAWHPFYALILTGSHDQTCKLWDPRAAQSGSLSTLQGHTQAVSCVRWHSSGHYFLSGGRDTNVFLWDLRSAKQVASYQGHTKAVSRVVWHPTHPDVFASGGADGTVNFWCVKDSDGSRRSDGVREILSPMASMEKAHDAGRDQANPVEDLAWSPSGHVLATCSTEVRYWHRNKPGTMDETKEQGGQDVLEGL